MFEQIDAKLSAICLNLIEAEAHLHDLRTEMARLDEAGMYDAIPTESWQSRGGSGEYPRADLGGGY